MQEKQQRLTRGNIVVNAISCNYCSIVIVIALLSTKQQSVLFT